MGPEQIRRWESGALAHAVTDPFGQGPVPWLRGGETYFGDTGQVVAWYADQDGTDTDTGTGTRSRTDPGGGPPRRGRRPPPDQGLHRDGRRRPR
ncbi:hypothetical protein RKD37_004879 [Streptomyces ambofaciens]